MFVHISILIPALIVFSIGCYQIIKWIYDKYTFNESRLIPLITSKKQAEPKHTDYFVQVSKTRPNPELEEKIKNSVDTLDLMLDEFTRIKSVIRCACPGDERSALNEISGLCDRAAMQLRRSVPVIDELEEKTKVLRKMRQVLNESLDGYFSKPLITTIVPPDD